MLDHKLHKAGWHVSSIYIWISNMSTLLGVPSVKYLFSEWQLSHGNHDGPPMLSWSPPPTGGRRCATIKMSDRRGLGQPTTSRRYSYPDQVFEVNIDPRGHDPKHSHNKTIAQRWVLGGEADTETGGSARESWLNPVWRGPGRTCQQWGCGSRVWKRSGD